MKKIIGTMLLMLFVFSSAMAQKRNVSINISNGVYEYKISDSKQKFKLKVKGNIAFTKDEKDVASISSGGIVDYQKGKTKVKITPKSGGLEYVINGKTKNNLDDSDKKIVAECVQTLIQVGVNGEQRAVQIYQDQGYDAVIKEIKRLKNDYVQHIYFGGLMSEEKLSNSELIRFLDTAHKTLTSDYYMTEVIKKTAASYFDKPSLQEIFIDIAKSLKSDYYKAEVFKLLLKKAALQDNEKIFVKAITSIKSDYYQAEVLGHFISKSNTVQTAFSDLLEAVKAIKSDYYQVEVLSKILKKEKLTKEEYLELIQFTPKIKSDYYQAEVLKKIASQMPEDEKLKDAYYQAAEKINSSHYYGEVVRKLRK